MSPGAVAPAAFARHCRALALVLPLATGACASLERCAELGGLVYDVTTVAVTFGGDLLAAGTYYELGNCAFEEFVRQGGRRRPEGLALSRSTDGGRTWSSRPIPIESPTGLSDSFEVRGLAQSASGTLLAGVNRLRWGSLRETRDHRAMLMGSRDQGENWSSVFDFGHDRLLHLVSTPRAVVLAALCGRGIVRSVDGGTSWESTGLTRPEGEPCAELVLASSGGASLYAHAWGRNGPGFYRSDDDGAHWTRLPIPASGRSHRIAASAQGVVLASTSGPWAHELHRSIDQGATWMRLSPPYAFWTEQLAVAPDGTMLLRSMDNLLAPDGGSFLSVDHGLTWSRLNDRWTGAGSLPGGTIVADREGRLFAGREIDFTGLPSSWGWGGAIERSDDSGRRWQTLSPLLQRAPTPRRATGTPP